MIKAIDYQMLQDRASFGQQIQLSTETRISTSRHCAVLGTLDNCLVKMISVLTDCAHLVSLHKINYYNCVKILCMMVVTFVVSF